MWKGCAFANAARQGVFAAVLAAEGLTGPDEIFEGPMGFFQQVSGPLELDIENWGPPSMITRTSIKFWPAEYHSQSAIDAALQLRGQIGDPSQIQALRIFSFDAAVDIIGSEVEKWRPTSRETADHSMPYCVAVALLDGEVGLGQFTDERIARDDVRALMDRITILRDPALTARYPEGIPNRLEVTLADGRVLECEVTFPRGHDHNPMTDDEVIAKFRSLAGLQLPEAQVNELIQRVWTLETQDPGALLAATTVPQGAS
jgi:2-methylcitrate dehydratase